MSSMNRFGVAALALSAGVAEAAAAGVELVKDTPEVAERNATREDAVIMVENHKAAMTAIKSAQKALKEVRTLMRTNPDAVEDKLTALSNAVRLAQAHFNDIQRAPAGVTPKGRATRGDLVRDITGIESSKDVQARIKDTYTRSGLAD